ncbi:FUSC family protein [Gryllotalpicola reticulitermitis]|uniref:FUSC family protein n=1 Tax=Gryllotalpicola reticulitermitis TaxID=1184153 RepID=A0ABV8Q7S1_9MICO
MSNTAPSLVPRWRDLIDVRPHDRDHWAALRVGLAAAGPLVLLWAIGREDLASYAVFAAFASVYGRNLPHLSRLRIQSIAGLAQLASVGLGGLIALSPHRYAIAIPAAAAWAFCSSLLADSVRWTPPGPLFQIFGLTSVAAVAGTPQHLGEGLVTAVASVAWALAIGYVGRLLWRSREGRLHNPYTKPIVVPPAPRGRLTRAASFGAACLIAGTIPGLIGIGHPYWAMVSVIAVLSVPDGYGRVLRAVHRFAGTMLGLAVGAGLLAFQPSGLTAIVLMILLQAGVELFVIRNYSLALVLMTPLVLLMGRLSTDLPLGALVWQRGVETAIGVAVALAVALVTVAWSASRRRVVGAAR